MKIKICTDHVFLSEESVEPVVQMQCTISDESTEKQSPDNVQDAGVAPVVALESTGFRLEIIEADPSVDYNQVTIKKDDQFKDIKFLI